MDKGIVNSWSLVAFAKAFGKPYKGQFKNAEGEEFSSLVFENGAGDRTFVGFSSNLGELSSSEIVTKKNSLQVVQLESGSYKLCNQGVNSWEEISL